VISLRQFVQDVPFFVIAHRGASGSAPENTIAAFELAIASGAHMVELDVQRSSDRTMIVFHDHILGRTTNGHGHVRRLPYSSLQDLDAGTWFSPEFSGQRIPRLLDALELLRGRIYLNIELKPFDDNDPTTVEDVHDLVALVKAAGVADAMIFSSFDHRTLALVKHLDPSIPTLAIQVPGDKRLPSAIVTACGADAWGCALRELAHHRCNDARSNAIPYGVYTVNTQQDLATALSYGVQSVVTNEPTLILESYHALRP
jgi:glycerophosphoryl diester phosphodiesterase